MADSRLAEPPLKLLSLVLVVLFAAVACHDRLPLSQDLAGSEFSDIFAVEELLNCTRVVVTYDLPPAPTSETAMSVANEDTGSQDVASVLDSGNVWLLVNDADSVFGALDKKTGSLLRCSGT